MDVGGVVVAGSAVASGGTAEEHHLNGIGTADAAGSEETKGWSSSNGEGVDKPVDSAQTGDGVAAAARRQRARTRGYTQATMTPRDIDRARRMSVVQLNRKSDPRVRLESLTSAGTRCVLFAMYGTVIIAALITASDELDIDTGIVALGSRHCLDAPPAPGAMLDFNALPADRLASGCTLPAAGFEGRPPGRVLENVTAWVAQVQDLDRLDGGFSLSLAMSNITTAPPAHTLVDGSSSASGDGDEAVFTVVLAFTAVVDARQAADAGNNFEATPWERLHNTTAVRLEVECPVPVGGAAVECPVVELFSSVDPTQLQGGGGFTDYRITVEYTRARPSEIAGTVKYEFEYRDAAFTFASIGVRVALLLGTLTLTVLWCKAYCRRKESVVPQVKWVSMLLVSMLGWQNPVTVAAQLMPHAQLLHAIAEVLHSIAWAGIMLFWLLTIDSLKYPVSELPRGFHRWKVTFGVVFSLVTLALQLFKRASFFFPSVSPTALSSDTVVQTAVIASCALFLLLLVVWLVWFARSAYSTGAALRRQEYMPNRFRQLTFRFLVFQQTLVILFVVVVNAFPALRYLGQLTSGSRTTSDDQEDLRDLVSMLVGAYQPLGVLLLLSVYTYTVVVLFLPPAKHRAMASSGFMKGFRKRVAKATGLDVPLFSLETACWLFDLSWEAYYDPPGHHTTSSYGPMNMPPHGFAIDAVLSDIPADVHGLVLRRGPRVVVTFRGTSSGRNVSTDLTFTRGSVEFSGDVQARFGLFAATIPGVRNLLPLVHQGFWTAYLCHRTELRKQITTSLIRAGPHARLYLTGHSLGGALATLAAFDLHPLVRRLKSTLAAPPRSLTPHRSRAGTPWEIRRAGSWTHGASRRPGDLLVVTEAPGADAPGRHAGATASPRLSTPRRKSGGGRIEGMSAARASSWNPLPSATSTPGSRGPPHGFGRDASGSGSGSGGGAGSGAGVGVGVGVGAGGGAARQPLGPEKRTTSRLAPLMSRLRALAADGEGKASEVTHRAVSHVTGAFLQLGEAIKAKRRRHAASDGSIRLPDDDGVEAKGGDEPEAVGDRTDATPAAGDVPTPGTAPPAPVAVLASPGSVAGAHGDEEDVVVVVSERDVSLHVGADKGTGVEPPETVEAGPVSPPAAGKADGGDEPSVATASAGVGEADADAKAAAPPHRAGVSDAPGAGAGRGSSTGVEAGPGAGAGAGAGGETGASARAGAGTGAGTEGVATPTASPDSPATAEANATRARRAAARGRASTDWLGDRGLAGVDFDEEEDQGTGLVPDELEPDEYGDMDVVLYNYGSPRVGNPPFALMYDLQVPHSFRVVYDGDPIAGIPKFFRLFKHVGFEAEMDHLGNVVVDASGIEKHFRTPSKIRFRAHSMYAYRDSLRAARRQQGLPAPAPYSLYRPSV